jgi:hypothetical protein
MDADALEQTIKQDKQAGLRPWLVIASAGTTNVGAVDPLTAVGHISQQHNLWYHIDGAYGGFFVLCEEGRKMLAGMNTADSVVMDPHKTLFLPYGTGALLVKDRQKLYQSHQASAHYMQDALDAVEELSPADLSPELTKHFRGLRLWLPLKLFGVAPFRAALAEKIELARYFYHQIQTIDGFEVGPHPDLSVVTYRFVPKRGDADEFNRRLLQAVVADEQSDVAVLLIDATQGVASVDATIGGYAHEAGRSVLVVVNKWDLVEKDPAISATFEKDIRSRLKFLDYAPLLFISAQTGQRVEKLFPLVSTLYQMRHKRITTGTLNAFLKQVRVERGGLPPDIRIHYMAQVRVAPPTFVVFSDSRRRFHFSFERFLVNRLRERFSFEGTPIIIKQRSQKGGGRRVGQNTG